MRRVLHDLAEDNPSDIEKDYEDMRTSILGKGSVLNED